MNEKVNAAAEDFVDAMAEAVADKILAGIQTMMSFNLGGSPAQRPLGPLHRLPKPLKIGLAGRGVPKNGAGLLLPARKKRTRSKPGAVTEAILGALQSAGTKGLKAGEVRERVVAKVPHVSPHTIGVMLANLRSRGRVGSRGKRPGMSYFAKGTGSAAKTKTGGELAKPTK